MADESGPLADFEFYMLADDRPSHPMTYFIRLNLSGPLHPATFSAALDRALSRHPVLRSIVCDVPFGREYAWKTTDAIPFLGIDGEHAPLDFPRGQPIDLHTEVGLRLWIRNGLQSSRLWLQFHHCCCDGLGAFRFVEDLLACYAGLRTGPAAGPPAEPRPVNGEALAVRKRLGLTWSGLVWRLPQELRGLAGALKFFLNRPIAVHGTPPSTPVPAIARHEAYCSHDIDSARIRKLRQAAHAREATLNDLLLREYFLALDEWISVHQPEAHGRCVRVIVPMNLREPGDEFPAANVLTLDFVDRKARDCTDAERLLAGLRDEMRLSKTFRLGLRLMRVVGFVRSLGLDLEPLLGLRQCLTSSVFSNLGEPFAKAPLSRCNERLVAGDVIVESIDVVPTLRPHTNVSLVAMAYGGQIRFTLHYDARLLSITDAQDLMSSFAWRLEASTSTPDLGDRAPSASAPLVVAST